MGLIKPFSSCRDDSCETRTEYVYIDRPVQVQTSGNPNPKNFRIMQSEKIGRFVILLVHYPDCHNFEGDKILVFEDVSLATLQGLTSLDPHFCDSKAHSSPVARFVPTLNGWVYATKFCKHA
jgi:hypothetical protein